MGRVALAVGGIALVGAGIAVGLGWWLPARVGTTTEVDRQVSQQIHTVRINDVGSGDVTIRTGPVATSTVHQKFHYEGDRPGDAYRVDGDQLVLSDCGNNCSVDFDVIVPSGTTVTGKSASGDIRISDTGAVDVSATSGGIRISDAGPVRASATSGNVEVSLADPQDVRVNATSGDVRVIVPADRYQVEGHSTSGDRDIQVVSDPAAPHVLDLTTTSGDVTAHTT